MPPYRLNTSRLPPWARPPPPDTSWLSIPPERRWFTVAFTANERWA